MPFIACLLWTRAWNWTRNVFGAFFHVCTHSTGRIFSPAVRSKLAKEELHLDTMYILSGTHIRQTVLFRFHPTFGLRCMIALLVMAEPIKARKHVCSRIKTGLLYVVVLVLKVYNVIVVDKNMFLAFLTYFSPYVVQFDILCSQDFFYHNLKKKKTSRIFNQQILTSLLAVLRRFYVVAAFAFFEEKCKKSLVVWH